MKFLVIIMLLAIVTSLGSGLYFMGRDREGSPRMLRALAVRVALSIALVAMLVAAYFLGWIEPTTLSP